MHFNRRSDNGFRQSCRLLELMDASDQILTGANRENREKILCYLCLLLFNPEVGCLRGFSLVLEELNRRELRERRFFFLCFLCVLLLNLEGPLSSQAPSFSFSNEIAGFHVPSAIGRRWW